ncbi:hypothetical protein ACFQHZ_14700 [Marivibrio halodurans]|uniref:hypothetical protein n=1 Tax=Marivibrio halodurans TaxID=2039722 RepID=UPI0036093EC3
MNRILEVVGEEPVNSLQSGDPDAEAAERFVDRTSTDIQSIGWFENTEENWMLVPDAKGHIDMPKGTLKVDTVGADKVTDVVLRGDRLYDRRNRTFVFDAGVLADVVLKRPFEELSHQMCRYIAAHAARLYQQSEIGSTVLDKFVVAEERDAWTDLLWADAEAEDGNVLTDNRHAHMITHRKNRFYGA